MSRHTDQEVLDAARRMFDSVRDGTLTILSKAKAAGREVWDVRHRPDGATRMTEMMMGSVRNGKISVLETPSGPAYTLDIYGGQNSFMETDGAWREVEISRTPRTPSREVLTAIIEKAREQNPNLLFLGVRPGLTDRSLFLDVIESSTRTPMTAVAVLSEDRKSVEEVRFSDEPEGLGL